MAHSSVWLELLPARICSNPTNMRAVAQNLCDLVHTGITIGGIWQAAGALEYGIVGLNEDPPAVNARKPFLLPPITWRYIILRNRAGGEDAMIQIILLLLIGVAAASNAFAGDGSRGFSNSDIKGSYGLLAQGSSAVPGTQIAFPAVYIGKVVSDGKGNLQGMGTINPGGPISGLQPGQSVTLTGMYDVETDGTGEFTGTGAGGSPSAKSNSNDPSSVLGSGALVIESLGEIELVSTETNRVFTQP
jgi:hypothetical protein